MAADGVRDPYFLSAPTSSATAVDALAPPVRLWFSQRFGEPTAAQRLAWPALKSGENLLVSAPTGNGKSLAAFLPIISELIAEADPTAVRCLYVAPLKALVADAARNLRRCLRELRVFVPGIGVRVGLRTGDSSVRSRRLLRLRPPDILLTTPESLAILLTQSFATGLFRGLRWVVLDELHALAANKRGADLTLSLERAANLARAPIQRIGLSATCAPLTTAARFLVGDARPCAIARVLESAPLQLCVVPVEPAPRDGRMSGFVVRLLEHLEPELTANRTTLVFTNVRSLAERLVWSLRRRHPDWAKEIAVHHSSVAAERRRRVERRLKAGKLRIVVSSTSLELGIDIGTVDGVVLVHPPGGVVRLLQRVGRAGHAPGQPRRGLVLTASEAELLEAVVTNASGQLAQCEPLRVPVHPLDVLCQQLLGLATQRWWTVDEAFELVRRAYPYRNLSRSDFDDCLNYLAGQNRDGEAWLPARLHLEGDEFGIVDARTIRLLRRNVGTIIADEPCAVCIDPPDNGTDSGRVTIGHVDEPFADRLKPGDRFLLDGRCLEFRRSEAGTVLVTEANGYPATPRWQGSGWSLSTELAQRIYLVRMRAAEALREGPAALTNLFRGEYGLNEVAALALVDFFQRQESISEVPDAATVLVECVPALDGMDYYVHTPLNRAGNDALARVAVHRLGRRQVRAMSLVADLGFLLATCGAVLQPDEFRSLFGTDGFDADLNEATADCFTLRERFRGVAYTGLMLLRNPLGRRQRVGGRDWADRQLFDQVRVADPDFVLLRQARRELSEETIDAAAGQAFAVELPARTLRWRVLPHVSPLAEAWTQATPGPMATVEGAAESLQRLHAVLMAGQDAPALP
ncbi:MAG: DEAD/DEAH box helicase [Gemmataceae bacterium]|nr:DEAD/DEAH box helicase [Gemmataceae bacterium]